MQVSLENTGAIGRKMTVTVPAERMEDRVGQRLASMSRSLRLPGFRPGKAPRKLIESKYGDQVMLEVAEQLINESYRNALGDEKVVPAGSPRIEAKTIERGKDLEFVAEFEVFPEIARTDLSGEAVTRPVCEVADADVDRTIESLRQRQTEWDATQDGAAEGDKLKVDFKGTIDGEPFEGGEGADLEMVLGGGSMLADFETGLAGATPGEDRNVEVSFPDDYPGAAVAGKTAMFAIKVKEVFHPRLPQIDEDFVKSLGIEDGTEESLRAEVRKNLERELKDRVRANVKNQVMAKLSELNPIELPAQLVDEEANRVLEATQQQFAQQGLKDMPVDRERVMPEARRRVALGLIVHEVVRANDIKTDDARVRERIEELASSYERPEEFVQWHYADRSRLANVEAMVLEEQVVEFLLESATVTDNPVSFEEFVNAA
ncbi:MAG: trigger factor [Proteobacteria bacterium]|nr:MAG: trigger factor [Pseudomonadota bacterium]